LLIDSTAQIKTAHHNNSDDQEEDSPYQNAPGELQMFNENEGVPGTDYYAANEDAEEEQENQEAQL